MKHSSIPDAYAVLGLAQDASLEEVKSTYRQTALKTHPDKNPGDEQATAQFQRLSEAYNVLLKHLDRSSRPSHPSSGGRFGDFYEDDEDGYYDSDDYYDDDDYDEYYSDDEDLDFYMFLFNEMMQGRENRYSNMRYFRESKAPPETPEQYNARLRAAREDQEAAERRRVKEEEDRKREQKREREHEKAAAESRQKAKKGRKKAEAEDSRKSAVAAARALQEKAQAARSAVFAAARAGYTEKVKKGVWEDNVDAAGGEIRTGCEEFVPVSPKDPRETLIHIAAKSGNMDLVEWLDTHNADIEERTSSDMTAFHLAVQAGNIPIIKYLYETYPPDDEDNLRLYDSPASVSTIQLASRTGDPELAWLVLNKGLADKAEIGQAWNWLNSQEGKSKIHQEGQRAKYEELYNLLMSFGGLTPPMSPHAGNRRSSQFYDTKSSPPESESESDDASDSDDSAPSPQQPTPTPTPPLDERNGNPHHSIGRGRGRGYYHNGSQPHTSHYHSGQEEYRAPQHNSSERGVYRGRGKTRGYRGRGRGQAF